MRYGRWGAGNTCPLWVADEGVPTVVPPCEYCGAPRKFEMQLMPQVLHYVGTGHGPAVGAAGLDFGTIAIFTCTQSCRASSAYAAEFAWVQPHSEQSMLAVTESEKEQLASIAKPIESDKEGVAFIAKPIAEVAVEDDVEEDEVLD